MGSKPPGSIRVGDRVMVRFDPCFARGSVGTVVRREPERPEVGYPEMFWVRLDKYGVVYSFVAMKLTKTTSQEIADRVQNKAQRVQGR
jgi:uncharacterized OB-fold protein